MTRTPCRSFTKYKAIYPPKCNCIPCWDKFFNEHPGEIIGVQKLLERMPTTANTAVVSIRGDKYFKQIKRYLEEHIVNRHLTAAGL